MTISAKQFGHLFPPSGGGGGFSTDLQGNSPAGGYMVSQQGTEETHLSTMIHPDHLDAYRSAHMGDLTKPHVFMGGWHDTSRGAVDLDVSHNMPSGGVMERAAAHGAMIEHGQRSLYNVDTDDIETNKYYGPHEDHAVPKQEAWANVKSDYERASAEHR